MKVIDVAQEIVRLGKENPDFVYKSPLSQDECVYVHDGKGSCIVGQALISLGVDIEILKASDYALVECGEGDMASSVLEKVFDGEELEPLSFWIDDVQRKQDAGTDWGTAVSQLESKISERSDGSGNFLLNN